tara:strand:- start:503 stop:613 length:111 start_codon:yes stop_codon:yes gene_type:complete
MTTIFFVSTKEQVLNHLLPTALLVPVVDMVDCLMVV